MKGCVGWGGERAEGYMMNRHQNMEILEVCERLQDFVDALPIGVVPAEDSVRLHIPLVLCVIWRDDHDPQSRDDRAEVHFFGACVRNALHIDFDDICTPSSDVYISCKIIRWSDVLSHGTQTHTYFPCGESSTHPCFCAERVTTRSAQ